MTEKPYKRGRVADYGKPQVVPPPLKRKRATTEHIYLPPNPDYIMTRYAVTRALDRLEAQQLPSLGEGLEHTDAGLRMLVNDLWKLLVAFEDAHDEGEGVGEIMKQMNAIQGRVSKALTDLSFNGEVNAAPNQPG